MQISVKGIETVSKILCAYLLRIGKKKGSDPFSPFSKEIFGETGAGINQEKRHATVSDVTHYGTKNCFNYGIKVFNY